MQAGRYAAAAAALLCSLRSHQHFRGCHAVPQDTAAAKARGNRHYASAHPEVTVYTGPQSPRKAVTLRTLRSKYEKGQPITMVTAYDYPSAVHVSWHGLGHLVTHKAH